MHMYTYTIINTQNLFLLIHDTYVHFHSNADNIFGHLTH